MAEDLCIGSVHTDLVEHGVERVVEKWPELLPYQDLLEDVVNAERCRAAHIRCAEQEQHAIDRILETIQAQVQ